MRSMRRVRGLNARFETLLLADDSPLTFPSLHDGPLPLPQGERER
jgi:hypothetical protein